MSNTPEISDDQRFSVLEGTYCATAGCQCEYPKLSEAVARLERGFPAFAEAAEEDEVEGQEADPFAVDTAKLALHSLSGYKCGCPLCLAGKQRRDHAQRLSHPHSEQVARTTAGCHTQNDLPRYFDVIDYASQQAYTGGARYDLCGVNPATGVWMISPIASKNQPTIEAAFKSLHAPTEDLSKLVIRPDRAGELVAAAEAVGAFADPTGPHRPNSNKAERSVYLDFLGSSSGAFHAVWVCTFFQAISFDSGLPVL